MDSAALSGRRLRLKAVVAGLPFLLTLIFQSAPADFRLGKFFGAAENLFVFEHDRRINTHCSEQITEADRGQFFNRNIHQSAELLL